MSIVLGLLGILVIGFILLIPVIIVCAVLSGLPVVGWIFSAILGAILGKRH